MVYFILRNLSILIFKAIFSMKVCGRKYIPKEGGFILASNHVSYLDPIALGVACPRKLNYMARHDLFSNRLFARLLFSICTFPVKRDSADLSALREAMQRISSGKALVIFPEGSRRFDGTSCEPHPGIGFLASKLNVPVIPAFIKGTDRALPRGARYIRPTKISVYFGKEILIERRMPYQAVANLIMDNIRHLSC
jgi:1-acyl-sn-glycerol-3-phosphate acyltransferase